MGINISGSGEDVVARMNADPRPVHLGFARGALAAAWAPVFNHGDWKAEICAIVDEADLNVTLAAIEFFTATTASALPIDGGTSGKTRWLVRSVGYRMGPAGP